MASMYFRRGPTREGSCKKFEGPTFLSFCFFLIAQKGMDGSGANAEMGRLCLIFFASSKPGITLLIDLITVHMTADVVHQIHECCTVIVYLVLAGYASRRQLVVVGRNKPFKDRMRNFYEAVMVNSREANLKRGWMEEAWQDSPRIFSSLHII